LRADAQPLAVMAPDWVDNPRQAFEVMEEMAEIKRSMWFKGRYRPDAVTVSLLLKAGVDGKLLDKLPRVLELMVPTTVLFLYGKTDADAFVVLVLFCSRPTTGCTRTRPRRAACWRFASSRVSWRPPVAS